MYKLFLLLLFILFTASCGQQKAPPNHHDVQIIIDHFFKAIDNQDVELFKKIVELDGQIWVVDNDSNPAKLSVQTFGDAIKKFSQSLKIIEKPLSVDIKIHHGIASAWVPYKLWIDGKFSHCGVDTFTLVKMETGWKIVNISYTKETEGCDLL